MAEINLVGGSYVPISASLVYRQSGRCGDGVCGARWPDAAGVHPCIQIAMDSKALVESQNVQVPILNTDYPAPSSYGRFNFYTVDEAR